MIETLFGFLPDKLVLICTIGTFVIPYTVYKINQKLHEQGDPEWKKTEEKRK